MNEPRTAGSEGKVCSACGSDEPHHVAYVLEHGVCIS